MNDMLILGKTSKGDQEKYQEYSKNVSDIRGFIANNAVAIMDNESDVLLKYFAQKSYFSRDLDYTIRELQTLPVRDDLIIRLRKDLDKIRYLGENLAHLRSTDTSETK